MTPATDALTPTSLRRAEEALLPYRPDVDGPFGAQQAGHAVRRIQFGGPISLRHEVEAWGPVRASVELTRLDADTRDHRALLEALDMLAGVEDLTTAQSIWLTRMLRSPRPFEEKLAVFWHGHFATSVTKVQRTRLMVEQVDTLRRLGPGDFGTLAKAVSRDPAMILWLDGNTNRRHQPNENYARELLELFCLGHGNYSERDVLEAARALSGWHESAGRFRFIAAEHDGGAKTVLGRSGSLGGDDVVEACLDHPACARWIASRLLRFFVHPEPGATLIDAAADLYRAEGHDTLAFLRTVFASRAFYAPRAYRALIKSPVELAVGAGRTFTTPLETKALAARLESLGQSLYSPPSVKGWDGGQTWLNTATLIGRLQLAATITASPESDDAVDALLDDQLPDAIRSTLPPPGSRRHVTSVMSLPEVQLA